MSPTQLSLKNLSVSFGGIKALTDVSFTVPKNSVVGLIGPNGAGKTTVFNCISGLVKSDSGKFEFDGAERAFPKPHELVDLGITRTLQGVGLFNELSVLQNVMVGADKKYKPNFVKELFGAFEHEIALQSLKKLNDVVLSQQEFEKYIGKVRLLYYNPELHQKDWLGDQQMGHVVKGYFNNSNFSSNTDGSISLWNVYNLMTEANKSSYIDRFIPKSMQIRNMLEFV